MAEQRLECVGDLLDERGLGDLASLELEERVLAVLAALACIALPRFSVEIPVWSWKAMNDSISGVVRTPPKSEITASIRSAIDPYDLVMAEPLAPLERPAEEGDLGGEAGAADRAGADQRPGSPQGLPLLAVDPELERRPALHAVGAVLGREQCLGDLDRCAVGIAEDRREGLIAVLGRALRARFAESASRPPSAKTIPIDRR